MLDIIPEDDDQGTDSTLEAILPDGVVLESLVRSVVQPFQGAGFTAEALAVVHTAIKALVVVGISEDVVGEAVQRERSMRSFAKRQGTGPVAVTTGVVHLVVVVTVVEGGVHHDAIIVTIHIQFVEAVVLLRVHDGFVDVVDGPIVHREGRAVSAFIRGHDVGSCTLLQRLGLVATTANRKQKSKEQMSHSVLLRNEETTT